MAAGKSHLELGKRERQIAEAVYRPGEASVSEVLEQLPDPPSYSCVRAMMGQLVTKGVLKYRRDGKRYVYRPAVPKDKASRSAMRRPSWRFVNGSDASQLTSGSSRIGISRACVENPTTAK